MRKERPRSNGRDSTLWWCLVIGRGSLEGGNGSINGGCQQLTGFMRPKFPPSARLDFQVTGYVPPGKKLVDEVYVVGPRKVQSLKALGVATRGAKFTSLTAITQAAGACTRYDGTCSLFSWGGKGWSCTPVSLAWDGLGLAALWRSSLWEVAPTVLLQYDPIRSNARDDTTACQKQTNGHPAIHRCPPPAGHWRWRIPSPPRARTATATYLAADKLRLARPSPWGTRRLRFAEDLPGTSEHPAGHSLSTRFASPSRCSTPFLPAGETSKLGPRCSYLLDGAIRPSELPSQNSEVARSGGTTMPR